MNPRFLLPLLLVTSAARLCGGAEPVNALSRSGQFTVQGLPLDKPLVHLAPTSSVTHARLDPMLLAVSGENIKQALLAALDLPDQWEGGISMRLHPLEKDGEEIVIASVRYLDRWGYRMDVPELVDKRRLVKAIVEVLLLEIAHRGTGDRRLDLPPWLAPGMAAHLTATFPGTLIVEPDRYTSVKEKFKEALSETRETLRGGSGLTLDELNWPDERTDPAQYDAAAHLFVRELLRLKRGSALAGMLRQLRNHLNWHIAFLRAFEFPTLREADKWWTLSLIQFAGRESLSLWSPAEVRAQLDTILNTPVQVRHATNQLPTTKDLSLQRVMQEWEFSKQSPVLQQKLHDLEALRLRSPQPIAGLLDDYRRVIASYIEKRHRFGPGKPSSPGVKQLLVETFGKLDECDLRKDALSLTPPGTPVLSDAQK